MKDEDLLRVVVHAGNQPVTISFDVEHRPSPYHVSVCEIAPGIRQIGPMCVLRDRVPHQKSSICIGVFGREVQYPCLADDPHFMSLHIVNSCVKRQWDTIGECVSKC